MLADPAWLQRGWRVGREIPDTDTDTDLRSRTGCGAVIFSMRLVFSRDVTMSVYSVSDTTTGVSGGLLEVAKRVVGVDPLRRQRFDTSAALAVMLVLEGMEHHVFHVLLVAR